MPVSGYLILVTLALTLSTTIPARAATLEVNSTDDVVDVSGCDATHCSLREAIIAANMDTDTTTVAFDIPGPGPHTIQPIDPLPEVLSPIIIDGTSEPDYAGTPVIELDGSLIPTDLPIGSAYGLRIASPTSTIRGLVVNRFPDAGLLISSDDNIVQGNYLGTDTTGTLDAGNGVGVNVLIGDNNLIGGTTPDSRNIVSGNGTGIGVQGSNNTIQGNFIGTDVTETLDLGNGIGIAVSNGDTNNNLIGGIDPGTPNVIAFNDEQGIVIFGSSTIFGTGNAILGNSIHSNGAQGIPVQDHMGIDLGPTGVTLNDLNDTDIGPNNLQNFPVLISAASTTSMATVTGTLNSAPSANYRIEFFANTVCDASGYGEGEVFLGSTQVQTAMNGNVTFMATLAVSVPLGQFITATATDASNNTSEFSQCLAVDTVQSGSTLTVNTTSDTNDGTCGSIHCSLREAIIAANTNPGADTISFNIPGPGPHTIQPTTNLPVISDSIIIDGASQPGYSGTPLIELDGSLIPNPTPPGQKIGLQINADNSTLRGLAINRFTGVGVAIISDNNVIQGNYIGTDITGTLDRGNAAGITIFDGNGNLIGGTTSGARNVISGNNIGLNIQGFSNNIQGNFIGTDVTGSANLGNSIIAIDVSQENTGNNTIGGILPGVGNTIAFNGLGIGVEQFGNQFATGIAILGNNIHSNENPSISAPWLGIDLGPQSEQGVTPNDPGDADIGPNNLQNFPVLTGVVRSVGNTTISGTLNSIANQTYRIEFFSNTACDPSGHGEGETFLGAANTTTDGSGNATFTVVLPVLIPPNAYITSTATDPANNTSEFSSCLQAGGVSADMAVNQTDAPDPVVVANNVVYTIIVANNGPDPATGVTLTDLLPANTSFISATSVQGSCLQNVGIVTCDLGALNPATSTSVTVIVQPAIPGIIANQVSVSANEPDLNTSNNSGSANTSVVPPPVTPTPSTTPTQPPAPPAFTPLPTLTPSDVPTATDVPPPSATPTPTNTVFLLPSATATNTPLPPPPPLNS